MCVFEQVFLTVFIPSLKDSPGVDRLLLTTTCRFPTSVDVIRSASVCFSLLGMDALEQCMSVLRADLHALRPEETSQQPFPIMDPPCLSIEFNSCQPRKG